MSGSNAAKVLHNGAGKMVTPAALLLHVFSYNELLTNKFEDDRKHYFESTDDTLNGELHEVDRANLFQDVFDPYKNGKLEKKFLCPFNLKTRGN